MKEMYFEKLGYEDEGIYNVCDKVSELLDGLNDSKDNYDLEWLAPIINKIKGCKKMIEAFEILKENNEFSIINMEDVIGAQMATRQEKCMYDGDYGLIIDGAIANCKLEIAIYVNKKAYLIVIK